MKKTLLVLVCMISSITMLWAERASGASPSNYTGSVRKEHQEAKKKVKPKAKAPKAKAAKAKSAKAKARLKRKRQKKLQEEFLEQQNEDPDS